MTCEHLIELERALARAGFKETFRGQAWSQNCREWVYFDCLLPSEAIRRKFAFADCVKDHSHLGTHDGTEAGFVCDVHNDGVMGRHPAFSAGVMSFHPE
ncbi:MAG: hypothetical protein EYC70_08150 [Planctomycetota bacterium]|nr:MAG: hypothetical protein EYC70_08150 [Planctomycetota bacterium]